jgi:hypothetical protein
MKNITRTALRNKIVSAIDTIVSECTEQESHLTIGGHTLTRRLIYAGGSQWPDCGRDWDHTESGWAWIVDDKYHLTTPALFGFNGSNRIDQCTPYYLSDSSDPSACPNHDDRPNLTRVPSPILLAIGQDIAGSVLAAKTAQADAETAAQAVIEALTSY